MTIRVFNEKAAEIDEGDIFIAHVRSIEGRKVVELVKQ